MTLAVGPWTSPTNSSRFTRDSHELDDSCERYNSFTIGVAGNYLAAYLGR